MAVRISLLSLFSLLSVAVVLSFQATSVHALSLESHKHHVRNFHHHDVLAKKRSTKQKRCKSRPAPSSASVAASSKPAPAAASSSPATHQAPAAQSDAPSHASSQPPASHLSSPSPSPSPSPSAKPSSAPPPASKPSSSSSSSVTQRLKQILPNKALAAFGGSPDQLSEWDNMDSYYNWGVTPSGPGGPTFIPTLWGTQNLDSWKSNILNGKQSYPMLRSMNEPEIDGQSNLSPQAAAELWNEAMLPFVGTDTLTVCPAMTSDGGAPNWLLNFFAACNNGHPNCGCDVMDFHYYGTDSAEFITYVQNMHEQFPLPIIITEFACQSFTGGPDCTPSQITQWATEMTAFFQSTDYVYAYAAFGIMGSLGNVNQENGLMNPDGSPDSLALIYYSKL